MKFLNQKLKEIEFVLKYKITQEQLTFLFIIYTFNNEGTLNLELIKKAEKVTAALMRQYLKWTGTKTILSYEQKKDLIEKDILVYTGTEKFSKDTTVTILDFEVTSRFVDFFTNKDTNKYAEQFYKAYPAQVETEDGKILTLKGLSFPDFKDMYGEIVHTYNRHKKMMLVLKYAREHGLINMSIKNYIQNEIYASIEKKFDMEHYTENSSRRAVTGKNF